MYLFLKFMSILTINDNNPYKSINIKPVLTFKFSKYLVALLSFIELFNIAY